MGEFSSGKWVVLITLYFIFMFVVVFGFQTISGGVSVSGDTQAVFYSGDYDNASGMETVNTSVGVFDSTTSGWSNFFAAISFLSGISADDYDFGISSSYLWLVRLIFFYIPFIMLIISVYFAIPFLH